MALTADQEAHVAKIKPMRDQLKGQVASLVTQLRQQAENLLRNKKSLVDAIADNQAVHDAVYGDDTDLDVTIDNEIADAEAKIVTVFGTGLLAETRAEMETRLFPNGGDGPGSP